MCVCFILFIFFFSFHTSEIDTIKQTKKSHKAAKQRSQAPIVGDLHPLSQALPELSQVLRLGEMGKQQASQTRWVFKSWQTKEVGIGNQACTECFFEILASTYGPGPAGPGSYGPGPLIILKDILSQICSRSIIWMHTAPGAYLLRAPGAVCISNMILEQMWLRIFFQIINDPEPYGPGPQPCGPGAADARPYGAGAAGFGPWVEAKISKKQTELESCKQCSRKVINKKNWGNQDISINRIWREIFNLDLCSWGRKHFVHPCEQVTFWLPWIMVLNDYKK